jgi:hypothetical protein
MLIIPKFRRVAEKGGLYSCADCCCFDLRAVVIDLMMPTAVVAAAVLP